MDLHAFLQEWGYLAVLILTFFEGETILVLGGVAAHLGHLELKWVILAAFFGSLIGDQLWFIVGRSGGRWLMAKRPQWQPAMDKINRLLDRHQIWFILAFRFLYGLRTVAPFAIGMSTVKTWVYVPLNILAAAIWAVVVAYLGYLFGEGLGLFLKRTKAYEMWLFGVLIVLGLCLWFWRQARLKREAKARAALSSPTVATSPGPAVGNDDEEPTPRTSQPISGEQKQI